MIIHLLICPLVQVSVSPFVLSLVGPSVNPRQRFVTYLKKHAPCVARTVHVNCVLHLKMRVFMEEEERKEEEEVEEEDD